jgi:DNA-binding MarR family transcriptional regulator
MSLEQQAEELHRVVTNFVRAYRNRDRDEICCHGISVAQCYALEAVRELGQPTMGELAAALHVSVSTLTRTLDPLVEQGFVVRGAREDDRRVSCACLTGAGRERVDTITRELLDVERRVLETISEEERDAFIRTLGTLSDALQAWNGRGDGPCC